ncbi:MAG: PhzF family phenazine biosynthesis protein, partial [Rickettsiales bacterium]|nr:PhzF family phenazine biosynthesis protein [Rickettsiales bacterium]
YTASSFVDIEDNKNIQYKTMGNPATIFLLDNNEQFIREEMSRIAIKEHSPMSCFIKNIKNNDFDIFFFNLDGSQAYMCGHGILATAYTLNKLYNITDINFYYDTTKFKEKIVDNLINVSVSSDKKAMIKMNMFHYTIIDKNKYDNDILECQKLLGLKDEDVECLICGKEYYDLTFILKDANKLRNLKPDFKKLAVILAEDRMDVRNLNVSAKSKENNFDFETRVFCPHDNLNEDVACGSSNLTISRYWGDTTGKNEFKILFPFQFINEGKVGGIQFIKIDKNKIFIGGYCR